MRWASRWIALISHTDLVWWTRGMRLSRSRWSMLFPIAFLGKMVGGIDLDRVVPVAGPGGHRDQRQGDPFGVGLYFNVLNEVGQPVDRPVEGHGIQGALRLSIPTHALVPEMFLLGSIHALAAHGGQDSRDPL